MTYVTALRNVTLTRQALAQQIALSTFASFSSSLKELVFANEHSAVRRFWFPTLNSGNSRQSCRGFEFELWETLYSSSSQ